MSINNKEMTTSDKLNTLEKKTCVLCEGETFCALELLSLCGDALDISTLSFDYLEYLVSFLKRYGFTHILANVNIDTPSLSSCFDFLNKNGVFVIDYESLYSDSKKCINTDSAEVLLNYLSVDPIFRRFEHKSLLKLISNESPFVTIPPLFGDITPFGSYSDKCSSIRLMLLFLSSLSISRIFKWKFGTDVIVDENTRLINYDFLSDETQCELSHYLAALNDFYLDNELLSKEYEILYSSEDDNTIAYKKRLLNNEEIIFLFNFSGVEKTLMIPKASYMMPFCAFDTHGEKDRLCDGIFELSTLDYIGVKLPRLYGAVLKFSDNNKINIKT